MLTEIVSRSFYRTLSTMLNMNFNIWCIAAAVLGLFAGYMFAYSARAEKPSGNEIAALFGTVLGGGTLALFDRFQDCHDALPLYVICVAVGYVLYVFVLHRNWALIEHLRERHMLAHPPLAPWMVADPCCKDFHNKTAPSAPGDCCGCGQNKPTSPPPPKEPS